MTTVDIVKLISENPLNTLSNTFNNKLLNRIKETFTDTQQQLFVASFYCYLKYDDTIDFVINLDDIWEWLGFNQKYNAKVCLEKNFTIDIDYKSLYGIEDVKSRGGHNKECIMLSINTFKRFCIKASTKKSDEIHNYFISLEKLLIKTIKEEAEEFKVEINKLTSKLEDTTVKSKEKFDRAFEDKLLNDFGFDTPLVYIIKVKSYGNDKEYIVKIGESRAGIDARYKEHKKNYEECLLLNCFECINSKKFEGFIHNKMKDCRVINLKNHEKEKELFLIGKEKTYKDLLDIINDNIKDFNRIYEKALVQDIQDMKETLNMVVNTITPKTYNPNEEVSIIQQLMCKVENFEKSNTVLLAKIDDISNTIVSLENTNKEILHKLGNNQVKTTTGFNEPLKTLGARLQQINPETLQLVKVFETVAECMKQLPSCKRPSLEKAIKEATIYNGYRWAYVDRDIDPNIIHTLEETKITKVQNLGYIAKVDKDKTKIINIYIDRKTASVANNYPSVSSLDNPVSSGTLTNNHYYIVYDKCNENLKKDFVERNGGNEPLLYKNGVGQFNTENILIKEFDCRYNCMKALGISDKTLNKCIANEIPYNGFYYKPLESKESAF